MTPLLPATLFSLSAARAMSQVHESFDLWYPDAASQRTIEDQVEHQVELKRRRRRAALSSGKK